MNGSSVNTYTLINSAGKVTYVKFRWVPTVGAGCSLLSHADAPHHSCA